MHKAPEWNLAPHSTGTAQPQQSIFEVDFSNTAQLLKRAVQHYTALHSCFYCCAQLFLEKSVEDPNETMKLTPN